MGLYVVLFLMTPAIFWTIEHAKVRHLLVLSWLSYLSNYFLPETHPGTAEIRLTGAQFEFAFPLLAWQLLFVHGVVAGCCRHEVLGYFSSLLGRRLMTVCVMLSLLLVFFSMNLPLPQLPEWETLSFILPPIFDAW